jgi:hypothetical protein
MSDSPKYCSIPNWSKMTGQSRTSVYLALGRADLRAIKLGGRTLIDVEHGLAWLRSLPLATINYASGSPSTSK